MKINKLTGMGVESKDNMKVPDAQKAADKEAPDNIEKSDLDKLEAKFSKLVSKGRQQSPGAMGVEDAADERPASSSQGAEKGRESREPGNNGLTQVADTILASMGMSKTESAKQPLVEGARTGSKIPHDQPQLNKVMEAICDRVLVSEKSIEGRQEVRISLKESVLPDTEIRIKREADGLSIEMISGSSDARQLLKENVQGLQNLLHQKLGEKVQVAVMGAGQSDGASGQGRSRQRRDAYEEMEE